MSASRSGAVLLSAYPYLKIRLACQRCTRRIQLDCEELIAWVGGDVVLPTLLLEIGERLGCEVARRNRAGDSTAGMAQCGLIYPDLLRAWEMSRPFG